MSNRTKEWMYAALAAIVITSLFRMFIFTSSTVSGESMAPNFEDKERVIVNKMVYDFRDPKRGEILIFNAVEEKDFIKRVIAIPGDTIEIKEQDVYVNGEKIYEPYIEEEENASAMYEGYTLEKLTIPQGSVFVMGDNRLNSRDSRTLGAIEIASIIGRVDLVYYPINKAERVKHSLSSISE